MGFSGLGRVEPYLLKACRCIAVGLMPPQACVLTVCASVHMCIYLKVLACDFIYNGFSGSFAMVPHMASRNPQKFCLRVLCRYNIYITYNVYIYIIYIYI